MVVSDAEFIKRRRLAKWHRTHPGTVPWLRSKPAAAFRGPMRFPLVVSLMLTLHYAIELALPPFLATSSYAWRYVNGPRGFMSLTRTVPMRINRSISHPWMWFLFPKRPNLVKACQAMSDRNQISRPADRSLLHATP